MTSSIARPQKKLLIYLAINLLLLGILGALIYAVNLVTQNIQAMKAEIANLSFITSQIAMLRDSSEIAAKIIPELQKILPDSNQLLLISEEFEELAIRSNLKFGFQYGAVEEKQPRSILFTISLEGSLFDITRYLESIPKELPYIIQISNFELSGVSEGGSRAVIAGKIFIR